MVLKRYRKLALSLAILLAVGLVITALPGCGEPTPAPAPAPAPAPKPAPAPSPAPAPEPKPAPAPKPEPKPEAPDIKYTLSAAVQPEGSGAVSPSSGEYKMGELVPVTAEPAEGYAFDRWGGDAEGTSPDIDIKMDLHKNVVAYFKEAVVTQTIEYEMPPGSVSAYTVAYSRQLEAGEVVEGFVELTGESQSADQFATWLFQVYGPANEKIQEWDGNIASKQHHDFSFTATNAGQYTIKISHISKYAKNLLIEIKPAGWAPLGS